MAEKLQKSDTLNIVDDNITRRYGEIRGQTYYIRMVEKVVVNRNRGDNTSVPVIPVIPRNSNSFFTFPPICSRCIPPAFQLDVSSGRYIDPNGLMPNIP